MKAEQYQEQFDSLRENGIATQRDVTVLQARTEETLANLMKIRDKDDRGKVPDVILPVTELDRANSIFERILYTLPPEPERKPERPLQQGREI